MTQAFTIPMSRKVLMLFYLFFGLVAGAVAWSFGSGIMWTAICLLAVAGPLGILYFYMLVVNPSRALVTVADEGIVAHVPPFFETTVPWGSITRSYRATVRGEGAMDLGKSVKSMQFGTYVTGEFELPGKRRALVATRNPEALCLETDNALVVLGPKNLDELERLVEQGTG